MKIAIMGIGGIGGFLGGKLARKYSGSTEHEICFICRGDHLEKIKAEGLKLVTPDEEFVSSPDLATSDPCELGKVDVLLFAVKGYSLEDAARMASCCVNEKTVVIPFLNGVDNAHVLKEVLPECRVLNGCVYISARIEAPGVVRHVGGPGKFIWGPENGKSDEFAEVQNVLEGAGINSVLSGNITLDAWKKFMFMSPYAGVTSAEAQTFGEVLGDEKSFEVLGNMISELEKVGRALGVELPSTIVEDSIQVGRNFPPQTKSSMQLDVEKGGKNELELFIGYVVKQASELGIDAPAYGHVYKALK
jgi:2-dehydropantoate 2-reductase